MDDSRSSSASKGSATNRRRSLRSHRNREEGGVSDSDPTANASIQVRVTQTRIAACNVQYDTSQPPLGTMGLISCPCSKQSTACHTHTHCHSAHILPVAAVHDHTSNLPPPISPTHPRPHRHLYATTLQSFPVPVLHCRLAHLHVAANRGLTCSLEAYNQGEDGTQQ
jgi:hypothetical protein